MRVYFVLEHLGGRGGVEVVLTSIVQELSRRGHEPHVFLPGASTDPAWEQAIDNVHYYYHPRENPTSGVDAMFQKSMSLTELFYSMESPDLVVATHVPHVALYARMALGYTNRIPLVSWLHNPPERFYDPHLINYADLHWAISSGIADKIRALTKPHTPVHLIGNPVGLQVDPIEQSDEQRYVFIGRLENKQKRLDVLFRALVQVNHQWKLDIYGTGPDEEALRKLVVDLGLQDSIIMHGWVDQPWNSIEKATALVLTSDFEGMPMVIGESLARGLPVISTDCETGPRDLIKHGENGWLVGVGDDKRLAEVLAEVALLSKEELQKISEAARASVQSEAIGHIFDRMKQSLSPFIPDEKWCQN